MVRGGGGRGFPFRTLTTNKSKDSLVAKSCGPYILCTVSKRVTCFTLSVQFPEFIYFTSDKKLVH